MSRLPNCSSCGICVTVDTFAIVGQVPPPSVDVATYVSTAGPAETLPGGFDETHWFAIGTWRKSPVGPTAVSALLSCQSTCTWPESAETSGKNWCPVGCGSIRVGAVQLAPPFVVFTKKIEA